MTFKERYQFNAKTDLLGKGGFSKVYRATDSLLHRTVALKFFTADTAQKYDLVSEIRRVITLEHPNLCRYYDVAILESVTALGETEDTQVGVMEFIDGGDLKSYTQKHPEHLNKLLIDVLQGLEFLHENGIIHRDLKPQNILIKITPSGPVAKITDFGISRQTDGDHDSSTLMGTIEYMAPEQFNPEKYGVNGKIGTNLDLWSFSMMVHDLVAGKPVFGSRSTGLSAEQLMSNILADVDLESLGALPEPYRTAVRQGLIKDARKRIQKAQGLIKILETNTGHGSQLNTNTAEETIRIPNIKQPNNEETIRINSKPLPQNEETIRIQQNKTPVSEETIRIPVNNKISSASEETIRIPSNNTPQGKNNTPPPAANPAPVSEPQKSKTGLFVALGVGAVIVVAALVIVLMHKGGVDAPAAPIPAGTEAPVVAPPPATRPDTPPAKPNESVGSSVKKENKGSKAQPAKQQTKQDDNDLPAALPAETVKQK